MSTLPRILLIDDEPTVLSMLYQFLKLRFEVAFLSDHSAAMTLIETEPFDIVLSDYMMPGMDGVTFFRRLMVTHPEIRRVLLTGYAPDGVIQEALRDSVIHLCLCKPISLASLSTQLLQLLETRSVKS